MNQITKTLLMLAAMAAVLGYTIYNYILGKTEFIFLAAAALVLGVPFMNLLNILIQELKGGKK